MKRRWGFTPLSFVLFENTNKTLTFVCYNTLKLCEEVGAVFKILVVEDDKELNRTVCAYFLKMGMKRRVAFQQMKPMTQCTAVRFSI